MPRYIVRLDGEQGPRYLEWSTIVDAPVTFGMSADEFAEHYRSEYGSDGMRRFPERIQRVIETGISARDGTTVEDLIADNRAGPEEAELSVEELYRAYGLGLSIRDGWKVEEANDE